MRRCSDNPPIPSEAERPLFTEHQWDTPGLPPRTADQRCRHHKHCAYRDDDPARCTLCHASRTKCTCDTYGETK